MEHLMTIRLSDFCQLFQNVFFLKRESSALFELSKCNKETKVYVDNYWSIEQVVEL